MEVVQRDGMILQGKINSHHVQVNEPPLFRLVEESMSGRVQALKKSERRAHVLLHGVVPVRVHSHPALGHAAATVGRVSVRGGEGAV